MSDKKVKADNKKGSSKKKETADPTPETKDASKPTDKVEAKTKAASTKEEKDVKQTEEDIDPSKITLQDEPGEVKKDLDEEEEEEEEEEAEEEGEKAADDSDDEEDGELPNRAPILDPYGPQLTTEQERERVQVAPSKIPGAGNGVIALHDFKKGDVVCEFCGKRCKTREEAYNGMMYAIEFHGDSGDLILLDGYGFNNAAAIANDALGRTRLPRQRNNARFTHYGDRMFLCAKRNIRKGEEIFVQYGHEYWQMTEEEYYEINMGPDTIVKNLDTCH